MGNEGISVADALALSGRNYGGTSGGSGFGGWGGDGGWWIILFFSLSYFSLSFPEIWQG